MFEKGQIESAVENSDISDITQSAMGTISHHRSGWEEPSMGGTFLYVREHCG